MGMTEGDLQGQESGTEQSQPVGQGSESSESEYSPFASDFLTRIPENDRAVVERYIKQWDSGVTRRFQDIHGQYAPYKQLGEVEELQKAVGLVSLLDEQPENFYKALGEQLGLTPAETKQVMDEQNQQQQPGGGLPPEFVSRVDEQEKMLRNIAEYVLNMHQAQEAATQDSELNSYMKLLHDEYGDFDDDYVLTKMYNGADGEQAVKAFQNLMQQRVNAANSAVAGLPPTLSSGGGSGGAVPRETLDLGKVPSKDVKALVADIIAQANR